MVNKNKNMKISVCLASYNGEKYIKEQLSSILKQLSPEDEVIVSDDSSSDNTIKIIESFNNNQIKLYRNQQFKSPIYNFENAIKNSSGDVIVLSDQDDVWENNKLDIIRNRFKNIDNNIVELYNGICIDEFGNKKYDDLFIYLNQKQGFFRNIYKNSFIGCNMAFKSSLKKHILPFPKNIPMHDSWIGLCGYLFGNVNFVDYKIFRYRLHSSNYTGKKTSIKQKIKWRFSLIFNLIKRYFI